MTDVKVAVIGAWGHLVVPLEEMGRMEGVRVVGVAKGEEQDDLAGLCARFAVARDAAIYGDHRKMLADLRPDVVIVSTRLDRITGYAIDAAEAGAHVICEKPLAIEMGKLRALWEVVRARGVRCVPMLHNRAHPVMRAARKLVADGVIGEVALVNARKSYKWGTRPAWFGDRKTYGGTIPWIGIHALDFITGVTGEAIVSVAGMQGNKTKPERPGCEDHCALVMGLSGGGHATASIDLLRPAGAATHGDDWVRVVGSKGVVEAYLTRGRCELITAEEGMREVALPGEEGTYGGFFREVREGQMGEVSGRMMEVGFGLTHACLVARDAADGGRVMTVTREGWKG